MFEPILIPLKPVFKNPQTISYPVGTRMSSAQLVDGPALLVMVDRTQKQKTTCEVRLFSLGTQFTSNPGGTFQGSISLPNVPLVKAAGTCIA